MTDITLGSLDLDDASDPDGSIRLVAVDFNAPPTEIREVTSALADKNLQTDVRTSAYRDITIALTVTGTNKQNLVEKLAELTAEIGKDSNTLAILPDGQTSDKTVTFVIGRNPEPEFALDQEFAAGLTADVSFVLKAEPYSYGTTVNVTSQDVLTPGLASFTVSGERPVPLDLSVIADATDCDDIHALYLAPVSTSTIGDYLQKAGNAAFSWTDNDYMGETAPSYGNGSVEGRKNTTTLETWAVATWTAPSGLPDGRYRLLCRTAVKDAASGHKGEIKVKDGSRTLAARTIDSTTWTLFDFGDIDIPQRSLRSGGSGTRQLTFEMVSYEADVGHTNAVFLDQIVLLPSEGLFCYHPDDDDEYCSRLDLSGQLIYRDDYADFSDCSGRRPRLAPGTKKLLVAVDEETASEAQPKVALSASYAPRFVLWRSS